jgi:hypothetical protein
LCSAESWINPGNPMSVVRKAVVGFGGVAVLYWQMPRNLRDGENIHPLEVGNA